LPAPSGVAAALSGPATTARVPAPVRLIIPAIRVRTRLVGLGLTAAGTLQAPRSPAVAGWYTGGPRPGAVGPAVIAGHIDSLTGPGVFFRLRLLRPGERVYVRRADGSLVVFKITSVRSYPKSKFPTEATYGPVPTAQLRLVTCGGTFDPATGSYLRNVIAYAILAR
jgi:sortase (surface protein transpeptidase)